MTIHLLYRKYFQSSSDHFTESGGGYGSGAGLVAGPGEEAGLRFPASWGAVQASLLPPLPLPGHPFPLSPTQFHAQLASHANAH